MVIVNVVTPPESVPGPITVEPFLNVTISPLDAARRRLTVAVTSRSARQRTDPKRSAWSWWC